MALLRRQQYKPTPVFSVFSFQVMDEVLRNQIARQMRLELAKLD